MLVLIISVIILSLLMSDIGWSNVLSSTRNNVVFENRNKEYGAYKQRKEYHRGVFIAFFSIIGCLVVAVASPKFFTKPIHDLAKNETPPTADTNIVVIIPNEDKVEPLPETKQEKETTPKKEDMAFMPEVTKNIVIEEVKSIQNIENPGFKNIDGDSIPSDINTNPTGGGNNLTNDIVDDKPSDISVVDELPVFKNGLQEYIAEYARYPKDANEINIEGTVYVTLIINKDGSVKIDKIKRPVYESLDNEAIRVLSIMPNWIPAKINGRPVKCRITVPVKFKLH